MTQTLPADVFPHHFWSWLKTEYNLGDVFYFDVWPMGPPTMVICDGTLAEQVTVKHSLDKHPIVGNYTKQHLGIENLAATNGTAWKKARATYNPGFSTKNITDFIPDIVSRTLVFRNILAKFATSGEIFELEEKAMKLTFDVVGKLVLYVRRQYVTDILNIALETNPSIRKLTPTSSFPPSANNSSSSHPPIPGQVPSSA